METDFNKITFDPAQHRYFYDGRELVSTTTILGQFKKPFDGPFISLRSALKELYPDQAKDIIAILSKDDYKTLGHLLKLLNLWTPDLIVAAARIRQEWMQKANDAATRGTKIHEDLEYFHKTFEIPDNPAPESMVYITWFQSLDNKPNIVGVERKMGDTDWGLAGTADFETQRDKRHVNDFKSNEKITDTNFWNDYYLPPFDDLKVSKLTDYSIQTSMYRCYIERNEDIDTGKSTLVHLPPTRDMRFIECHDYRDRIYDFFGGK